VPENIDRWKEKGQKAEDKNAERLITQEQRKDGQRADGQEATISSTAPNTALEGGGVKDRDEGARRKFEDDYKNWIVALAREASRRLGLLRPSERDRVARLYRDYRDPRVVLRPLSDTERFRRLVGDRASSYVLAESDAITFAPSMYSSSPGVLDFAVAMNRRFYYQGMWFPIIAFNSSYVSSVDDRLLQFTLEHEFEMSRVYQEISLNLRALSEGEKKEVVDSAQKVSQERLSITPEDVVEDEKAMIKASFASPMIPKPYAEAAMLLFLKDHYPGLKGIGVHSKSPQEEAFGKELYGDYEGWADFSIKAYRLFVQEVLSGLRDADIGYI
jgi:hypothetical protein